VFLEKLGTAFSEVLFQADNVVGGKGDVGVAATGVEAGDPLVALELEGGAQIQHAGHYIALKRDVEFFAHGSLGLQRVNQ
jgi:hypothetical protein